MVWAGPRGCGRGERTRESVLCRSLVFVIGSTHMLDSERPKQTCLCVLPKIILLGVLLYLLATYIWFLFLIVAVLWNLYWHLLFFPLGLLRFGLLNTEEIVSIPGAFLCPGVTLLSKLTSNPFLLHVTP